MFIAGGIPRFSVRDLARLSICEFQVAAEIDALLGKRVMVTAPLDPMVTRVAPRGVEAEAAYLERSEALHGRAVRPLHPEPGRYADDDEIEKCLDSLREAAERQDPLIYQPLVSAFGLHGYTDFLEWDDVEAAYMVVDAKYGRTPARGTRKPAPEPEHRIQVTAYAMMLAEIDIPTATYARLAFSDMGHWDYIVAESRDVVLDLLEQRDTLIARLTASPVPEPWDAFRTCGTCIACEPNTKESRDVLACPGVGPGARVKLASAGVVSIDDLASTALASVPGIGTSTFSKYVTQARLHVRANPPGEPPLDPIVEVFDDAPIRGLPVPNAGDLFFDLEADANWGTIDMADHGLEYLWGVSTSDDSFTAFWAHDREQESQALRDFLDFIDVARIAAPDLHVYHYSPYEIGAMRRVSQRAGFGGPEIDGLIGAGVFLDLLPVVKSSIRTSQPGLSIKHLEPFYMGDDLRLGVETATESVAAYYDACLARDDGDMVRYKAILAEIEDYNRYDCISTRHLRDWLGELILPLSR